VCTLSFPYKAKLKQLALMSCSGGLAFSLACVFKGDERFYADFLMPAAFKAFPDAERAHRMAVRLAAGGWIDLRDPGDKLREGGKEEVRP